MRFVVFVLRFLPLAAILLVGGAAFLLIEARPALAPRDGLTQIQLEQAEHLTLRIRKALESSRPESEIVATEAEIDSLLAFAARGASGLEAGARVAERRAEAMLTFSAPSFAGAYLNVRLSVQPSTEGLDEIGVRVGRIGLPRSLARLALETSLGAALGRGLAEDALRSVSSIDIEDGRVSAHIAPKQRLKARIKERLAELSAVSERALVAFYFEEIERLRAARRNPGAVGFGPLLRALLEIAAARGGDVAAENRAALLALGFYLSEGRLQAIAGGMLPETLAASRPDIADIELAGRLDIAQHFAVSAALTLAAGEDIGGAMGEMKEIRDSRRGGSGFSFRDLAADRAGAAFARAATDPARLARLTNIMRAIKEDSAFLPEIADLRENMDAAAFENAYGGFDSPAYKAVMAEIDRRIAGLAVFAIPN